MREIKHLLGHECNVLHRLRGLIVSQTSEVRIIVLDSETVHNAIALRVVRITVCNGIAD